MRRDAFSNSRRPHSLPRQERNARRGPSLISAWRARLLTLLAADARPRSADVRDDDAGKASRVELSGHQVRP